MDHAEVFFDQSFKGLLVTMNVITQELMVIHHAIASFCFPRLGSGGNLTFVRLERLIESAGVGLAVVRLGHRSNITSYRKNPY